MGDAHLLQDKHDRILSGLIHCGGAEIALCGLKNGWSD